MCRKLKWLSILFFAPVLVPVDDAAAWEYRWPVPSQRARSGRTQAEARLAKVVNLVERSNAPYLIGEKRWRRLLAEHRDAIEQATTHGRFAGEVNKLLKSTGVSHFKYYTDHDWTYWHVRGAFWQGEPDVETCHVGIFPERIEGRWFVRGVLEGSNAASAAIRVGDELLSVDGLPFDPIVSFQDKAGRPTHLRVRRKPGLICNTMITPVRESLYEAMQDAIRRSIRVIEHDGLRMGYMHAWTLLGPGTEYGRLAELQDQVDGLLLDYRDGFGGTWHAAERFLLGHGGRAGSRKARSHWTKPVVILIADGTRSAKEIVVDAVQTAGRAPLVGTPTPGAVTSVGAIRRVGENGLLMLPGQTFSLEGNPTRPDYPVSRDIRHCAGADPQLKKAKQILADLILKARNHTSKAVGR